MAVLTHRIGKVTIEGTQILSLDNATLAVTVNTGEVTGIGDSWQDYVTLIRGATLTLTASYDPTANGLTLLRDRAILSTEAVVTSVAMWEDAASHSFAMSGAMVIGPTYTKSYGAVDKMTFTLTAKGAITRT